MVVARLVVMIMVVAVVTAAMMTITILMMEFDSLLVLSKATWGMMYHLLRSVAGGELISLNNCNGSYA